MPHEELAHHPVVNVSWYEAMAFCRWLQRNGFAGARLPIEEEWEYACRAGTASQYWSGDNEDDLAGAGWYSSNSDGRTHRVGQKPANPWGIYDMHGNVLEWTLSQVSGYSGRERGFRIDPSTVDPTDFAVSHGGVRVVRGGGFAYSADRARAAYRNGLNPGGVGRSLGFRIVLPAAPEP